MKICNKSQTTKSPATENPPTSKQTTIAKLDSGASANYFRFQDAMHCLDDIHEDDGPSAITPTLETIKATKAGSLPLAQKNLSDDARKAHIFSKLGSASLISVANMCDDGCQVLFDRNHAYITKNKKLLITADRNWQDKLWDIKIPRLSPSLRINHMNRQQQHNKMSIIIRKHQSKLTLAKYHHHTLFGPTEATLRTAIRNKHLITWPGLTQELLTKGLPQSEATAKGHMKQQRQNLQSIKTLLQQAISTSMSSEQVGVREQGPSATKTFTSQSKVALNGRTILKILSTLQTRHSSFPGGEHKNFKEYGDCRNRTSDLPHAKRTLYQLS